MSADAELEQLIARLESAAERLRTEELSAEDAALLIEECAGLAVQASTELERRARGEQAPPAEGQESLTGPRQDSLL
jgi:hypothetical protein